MSTQYLRFVVLLSVWAFASGNAAFAHLENASESEPQANPTQNLLDSTDRSPVDSEADEGKSKRAPASAWWTVGPFDRADR